jgi:hypothetical protein
MARRRIRYAAFYLSVTTGACGGNTQHSTTAADGGEDAPVSNEDSGSAGVAADAAPNPCISPAGYAVCGGPNACFPTSQQSMSSSCWECELSEAYSLTLCINAAEPNPEESLFASDGDVFVEDAIPGVWDAFPWAIGALFASNGASDRVRYADFFPWTGDPLPTPSSCPTFADFSICGGECGPCAPGDYCTGRSPHHPYGLCEPDPVLATTTNCDPGHAWACPSGDGCVVLQSSSDGQALADANGICVPSTSCQAIAAQLPGGANCHAN